MTGPRTFGADTKVTLGGGRLLIEIGGLRYEVPADEVALDLKLGTRVLVGGHEVEIVDRLDVGVDVSGAVNVAFRGSLIWQPQQRAEPR